MLQPIKMEHCFDLKGLNIKDGVQDGRKVGFLRPILYLENLTGMLLLFFSVVKYLR